MELKQIEAVAAGELISGRCTDRLWRHVVGVRKEFSLPEIKERGTVERPRRFWGSQKIRVHLLPMAFATGSAFQSKKRLVVNLVIQWKKADDGTEYKLEWDDDQDILWRSQVYVQTDVMVVPMSPWHAAFVGCMGTGPLEDSSGSSPNRYITRTVYFGTQQDAEEINQHYPIRVP